MSTSRTEIKFQPNVPVEVLLDRGSEGKEYPSKFENAESRWYYTVNGNTAFMYLPTTARNQLVRTRAAAGDTVRICKTVDGKSTQWYVEVLSDAVEPPATPAAAPGPRIVAPAPARTNGANALAAQPAPIPPQSQGSNPLLRQMYQCLLDSFTVNMRAWEQCTKQTGVQMEAPNWEDIRTAANTLFIEINKRAREERY
jgi:hypothetical protein